MFYICTKFQENISKGFRVIKGYSSKVYHPGGDGILKKF